MWMNVKEKLDVQWWLMWWYSWYVHSTLNSILITFFVFSSSYSTPTKQTKCSVLSTMSSWHCFDNKCDYVRVDTILGLLFLLVLGTKSYISCSDDVWYYDENVKLKDELKVSFRLTERGIHTAILTHEQQRIFMLFCIAFVFCVLALCRDRGVVSCCRRRRCRYISHLSFSFYNK